MSRIVLHNFFRSSTSFRVRAALNIKGLDYEYVAHHLPTGKHRERSYLDVNPQGLMPAIVWNDGTFLAQSLAILEFIDDMVPEPPLMPAEPHAKARVRMLAQMIGCDIHPVNNLRVLNRLRSEFGADDAAVAAWFRHWVAESFGPLEDMIAGHPDTGRFCHGDTVTIADLCLVAQVVNNIRFGVDMSAYPTINRIHATAMAIPEIDAAQPMKQPDAV